MTQQNLSAPPCAQVSHTRRLIASGFVRRAPEPQPEPSDLPVAIRVARRMLAVYGDSSGFDVLAYAQAHGGLTEALRLLLRALDAETSEGQ